MAGAYPRWGIPEWPGCRLSAKVKLETVQLRTSDDRLKLEQVPIGSWIVNEPCRLWQIVLSPGLPRLPDTRDRSARPYRSRTFQSLTHRCKCAVAEARFSQGEGRRSRHVARK